MNKALSDNHPTVQSQASDALKHFEEIPIEVRQLSPFERIKWHVNKIPRLSQHNQLKSKPKDNHIDRSSLIASLQSSDRATRSKAIEQLEKFSNDENFYSEVFRALERFDVETNHIDAIVELLETTQAIQKSCKYYNYEIYQQAQSVSIQSVQPASVSQVTAEEQYEDILNTISHMARVMERSPYSFRNMGEEDIRHHFLVQLNGKHRGQATGETFNNKGKPDILIRISDENVLIAECKFWHGAKLLKETISQLLGYATWRDTKLAVLVFNQNKKFSEVLTQIPKVIKEHSNVLRQSEEYLSETGFRFILHHPDDRERELILTVLAFNIPQ